LTQGFLRPPPRLIPLGAVLVALVLLVPVGGTAQSLDEALEGEEVQEGQEPAGPDSAAGSGSGPAAAQGMPPPSYNTSYNVDRQVSTWLQNFTFGTRVGFVQLNNTTNFNVRTDSGRDETRKDGDNRLNLQWLMIRELPVSTDILISRSTTGRPGEERETNVANLNASAVFNPVLAGVRNTLTLGGGYNRTGVTSVLREASSKSTDFGWQGNMSWRGSWRASSRLNMNGNLRQQLSNKTSELQSGSDPANTTPTKNQQRAFNLTANFDPVSWASTSLTLTDNHGEDETYIVQGGQGFLDKKFSNQRSLAGRVSLRPRNGTDLVFNFNAYNNGLSFSAAQRRDNASDSDGLRWDATLQTKILQTDIEGTLSGSTDNTQPATSPGTKNVTNIFEGKAFRPMNRKVSLQLDWLLRTTQLFFSDPDPLRLIDRDEIRTKIQPTLRYQPGKKWQITAAFIRSTSEQVQLNPTRAAQTRTDEDFTVDTSISFYMSDRTTISQIYSIKALYTTFRYNPSSDRLLRTQRILTTLESTLTSRVFLGLEHRFTRQDSGPFRTEPGAGRIFARNLRSYTQELTANLDYRIKPWIIFTLSSRLLRDDDIQEATQESVSSKVLEVRQGLDVNRNLGLGMSFRGNAYHTRSNVRDSYWTIVSSLNKEF
jgi:hypothetical protein